MSEPTYAEYNAWDELRRRLLPAAKHWIYKSRIDEFNVAEFCPLTGRQYVQGAPKGEEDSV